jgi:manganese transport protein
LNLAEACRLHLPRRSRIPLWLLAEVGIVACDLAELVGSAIALQLLFHLPLVWGVVLTGFDTLLVLVLQQQGVRRLEALIIALVALVGACFAIELLLVQPDWMKVVAGLLPCGGFLQDGHQLYLASGILGATVMPHNLYLHTGLMQTCRWLDLEGGVRRALRYATADVVVALTLAFLINAAILVVAGASFHGVVDHPIEQISEAYRLLSPLLGTPLASLLFAVALLAAGQSSTITGTMAGQVVMEGFLQLRLPDWQRRLLTRSFALIPALAVVVWMGEGATADLLVLSQVVLSLQLPFAVIPLMLFCTNRQLMVALPTPRWLLQLGWLCAGLIVLINAFLLASGTAS